MSFICKESDILFIDKELFTYENKEFAERYNALYRDGHSQATEEDVTVFNHSTPGPSSREEGSTEQEIEQWLWEWGEQIEALFDDFPILRDVCKGLKRNQYPAALFVSGGFMMTLMTRCRYSFYHRPEELRRLNCEVQIIGDPASGKSFATRLYKQLIAPL